MMDRVGRIESIREAMSTIIYEDVIEKRINRLIRMDEFMRNNVGDEMLFMRWIVYMPDEATLEDYEDIAVYTESYMEMLEVFSNLMMENK